MDSPTRKLSDMDVDEFRRFLRDELQLIIRQAVREALRLSPSAYENVEYAPLNLPADDLGPWSENFVGERESHDG